MQARPHPKLRQPDASPCDPFLSVFAGTGSGANVFNESETVAKFEIMDGATAPPARMRSS